MLACCRTFVNGVSKQDSNTADMIFDCRQIIEWLSTDTTLLPGTVILTGTVSMEAIRGGYIARIFHSYPAAAGWLSFLQGACLPACLPARLPTCLPVYLPIMNAASSPAVP
jgi:hypothetical protein